MIPILDNSTTLQGNGLGRLADLLTCSVVHEINGEYELRATYPVTGQRYDDIAEGLIIWATPDNVTARQAFRIYRITKPLNGIITIYARHISYDMSGIIVEPFSASSLQAALTALPSHCVPSCPFTFTTSRSVATTFRVTVPTPLWALLGGQQGSFLDIYGGEWNFNNLTADLASHLGQNRGVSVRYGKNLTELTQDVTVDESYGAVYPYYYDEESGTLVTLPEKYVSVPDAAGDRIMLLDCSGDFDTAPSVAQLQARASAYINANDIGQPKISWKVNFAMLQKAGEYEAQAILEQVQLGDTLSIFYEPLSLTGSSRAVRTEYDVLREEFISVTLGRVKQNLAKIMAATGNEIKTAVAAARSTLEKEIDKATDFITNGTGVMRFIYNDNDQLQEIVSLDNPDLSQALSVWRWNNGGIGHSANGYNGPYTLALTPDGAINADLITVGTLSAARVRTGLLIDETETNWWNLDTGEFHSATVVNLSDRMATAEASISSIGGQISIVAQKLDNIGGRNYLWAMDPIIHDKVVVQNCTYTYDPDNNGEYVLTGGSGGAFQQLAYYRSGYGTGTPNIGYPIPDELKGQKVILHADYISATGSNPSPRFYVLGFDANAAQIFSYVLLPGTLSRTFTIPQNAAYMTPVIRVAQNNQASGVVATFRGVKLEKGEVATDWTPAPEDGQAQVTNVRNEVTVNTQGITLLSEKVDNIGGRNLLPGMSASETTITAPASGYVDWFQKDTTTPLYKTTYTLSFWAKSTVAGDTIYSFFYAPNASTTCIRNDGYTKSAVDGNMPFSLTTSWEKYYVTYIQASPVNSVKRVIGARVYPEYVTGTISMKMVKLEEGSVSTDWTPAPEDKTSNNEIIAKINISPETIVISASKVDLQGYVTFSNLSTSGQTSINGANIITGTLNANAIAANSTFTQNLTATNFRITGGSINITTGSSTTDLIQLNGGVFSTSMRPIGFVAQKSDNGTMAYYQAESITLYPNSQNLAVTSFYVNRFGNLTLGDYSYGSGSIQLKGTDSTEVYASSLAGVQVRLVSDNTSRAILGYDSNGGHLIFQNAGTVRTRLDNSGLTFSDSSNNLMASYPATGWTTYTNAVQVSVGTGWTELQRYTIPTTGWYILWGALSYSNSVPAGVSLCKYFNNSLDMVLSQTIDPMPSPKGSARHCTSCCEYLTAGEIIILYGKSRTAAMNTTYLRVHGPIA